MKIDRFCIDAEVALIGALLVLRAALLLAPGGEMSGDAASYIEAATAILRDGKLPPLFWHPRGYSLLLVPRHRPAVDLPTAVLLVQVAMDSAVTVVVLLFARGALSNRTARLIVSIVVIVQPFTATLTNTVMAEPSAQFFLVFGALALAHSWPMSGGGALGIASLIRVDLLPVAAATVLLVPLLGPRQSTRVGAKAVAIFAAIPLLMGALQYGSTGEFGLVRSPQIGVYAPQSGFYVWMRSWFATEGEYTRLHWSVGAPEWPGFRIENYPDRAFSDDGERQRIAHTLETWQRNGYDSAVDGEFTAIAQAKSSWFRQFGVSALRMGHFWINLDGTQTILKATPIRRPLSTIIVILVMLIKAALIVATALGCYAIWRRPSVLGLSAPSLAFARLASAMVLVRTVELSVLGAIMWGGLMEARYVMPVYPFVLVLAVAGICFVAKRRNATPSVG